MTYEEFKEKLKVHVEEVVGLKAVCTTVKKNNQIEIEVLTVEDDKLSAVPLARISEIYHAGVTADDIERIAQQMKDSMAEAEAIQKQLVQEGWEQVKNRLMVQLVNTEWNREQVHNWVHKEFLDLCVIIRVPAPLMRGCAGSYILRKGIAKYWGVDEEEIWTAVQARLHEEAFDIFSILDMVDSKIAQSICGEDISETDCRANEIYILTNQRRCLGAAGILRVDLLEEFARKEQCDLFILPSSLHEVILLKDTGRMNAAMLQELVREINQTEVCPQERLSNSVYYYRRGSGKVEVAV